jgi:hypothetical protein
MDQDAVAEAMRSAPLQEVKNTDIKLIFLNGYKSVSRFHE